MGLKLFMESPDMLSYIGLKLQVNQSSRRHRNTGQQRLYEFCYLLHFDLWTSYLARILFVQGCNSFHVWYWKFSSLVRIFNGNNIVSMCGMDSILIWRNPYGVCKQLFYPYYSRNISLKSFEVI
jgi:hypothetical protein